MKNDATNLPQGWCCTSLEKIASWGSGGTPSRNVERYFQGSIPWVKTGELESKYIRKTEEHISEEALKNSSAKIFPKGSVGIAMYGATIGKLSIWGVDASTNQACAVGIPSEAINNEFLYYFLLSERQNLIKAGKGGAQPNLSQGIIKEWPINLPPLAEQHRIVAKIEELFSELDKGIENLKTAQAQLKVYRQSLLKHAFEGKLTAQWRAENQDKLETADALLKRIQQERVQRYQQQLADWQTNGGSKPKAPKPLPPLTAEELAELPELPEGWVGARLGWMTCSVEYGTSAKSAESGTCPVLRMGNIQNGKFDWADLVYTDDEAEIAKYLLKDGDVLFNRTNSPELVGKSAIFKSKQPAIFAGYLIRVNQIATIMESQYLNYFLNSHIAKQHGNTVKTDGVNQSNINGEKLVNYPFPFCCLEEQKVIVELLDARLSEVDQLELTITTSLQQAEALRQSILKKAFSGQLVPQDPNDEPASELLARIRAERAASQAPAKPPRVKIHL